MAHLLLDFETVCNDVCKRFQDFGVSKADRSPIITLTEVFADGRRCTVPVTGDLLETYIEKDFEVST